MSNDFLLADARRVLDMAEACPSVQAYRRNLPLSPIWQNNEPMKAEALRMSSFSDALAHVQTRLFVHGQSHREAELAVRWNLARGFRAPEASPFAPEDSVVRIGGQRYWHDDFRHRATLNRMGLEFGGHTYTVVELGAGTGNMARMVKQGRPDVRYTIIDLPDTLVFSMMHLRASFPNAYHCFCVDEGSDIPDDADFVYVPVGLEHKLYGRKFDAFVNTASLGEMPIATVKHWFDFAQKHVDFKLIFSVNRFLNVIHPRNHAYRLNENTSAFCFDARWDIVDFEVDPDFLRCPWQNRHARQALIFARRRETDAPLDVHTRADIDAGSWNQPPHEMSVQTPALIPDFTRSGILFKAWEAFRLHPDEGARSDLLRYLGHLRGARMGTDFEEAYQLVRNIV